MDRHLVEVGALTWEEVEEMALEDEARRIKRSRIHLHHGILIRDGHGLAAQLNWCETHHEPVWVYEDDSFHCPFDLITQGPSAHEIVSFPFHLREHANGH